MVKKSRRARTPGSETDAVWRQVVDGLATPIAVVDQDGVVVAKNRAFRKRVPATVEVDDDRRLQVRDLDDARLTLVAVDGLGFPALDPSGLVFDCWRLDAAPGLVALVGKPL